MNTNNFSKPLISIIILIVVILLGFGGYFLFRSDDSGDDLDFNSADIRERDSDTDVLNNAEKPNIVVSIPRSNEQVGSPLIIQGEARVFENTVNYKLLDADGELLAEGFTQAQSPDVGQFGPFRGELIYHAEEAGNGTLEVFEISARDGEEIHKVTIPVRYTATPEFFKG